MLDNLWSLHKVHNVDSLEEFEFFFLGKVLLEGVVPKNKPPMFNMLGRV